MESSEKSFTIEEELHKVILSHLYFLYVLAADFLHNILNKAKDL